MKLQGSVDGVARAGMALHVSSTFVEDLKSVPCQDAVDFRTYGHAHVFHYKSTALYDRFEGEDMLVNGTVHAVRCVGAQTDRGMWHIERLGPFVSRGGYDWWQFGGDDLFGLSEVLASGVRLGFNAHWSGCIDRLGNPIGLPPLHMPIASPWLLGMGTCSLMLSSPSLSLLILCPQPRPGFSAGACVRSR